MYNSRSSIASRARQTNSFKVSLGNQAARNSSEVALERRKYFTSASKNSKDVPEWMNRTQNFHERGQFKPGSMFSNPSSPFKHVEQTYVYARLPRPNNPECQFDRLTKPRQRSKWEMKNNTFELDWPKPEGELRQQREKQRQSRAGHQTSRPGSKMNDIMRWQMPKYGYFETPLHLQKETPIKIGHPQLMNSTYVQ